MIGDPSSSRLRAARELRGLLRGAGTAPGLAAAALVELRGVLPYDCASLARWDPAAGRHRTVAAAGYPPDAQRAIDAGMHADPLFDEVRRSGRPVRVRDIPGPRRSGRMFDTVIGPLGFRDGLTHCLTAPDGRYLGMVNISTLDARQPDDDAVALLELLADDLAGLLDPLPAPVAATAALATGEADGLFVGRGGATALSPGARPELVGPRSPLHPLLVAALAGRPVPASALVVLGRELLAVALDPRPGGVVVLHRPASAPHGLTLRELDVLAALARGRTNGQVAAALGITPRTVAAHVEHLLAKTGAPNRAAAARLATHLGLLG
ncbi:helix-turn-helix transcriptional regulator [Pseudonocardia humida]|uniref:Helix-turn-helix transcriptional regulator n=1 Tax=Pseudonocardia humida TaxID=2800819 RepID=A0ABT0ZZJ2_9PSEU|nr:helix-turn-helix transcriptional regulator [Pseudonocardia humida]MCO1656136.1 helix-turn-helix transcriptional regulator [Pseudonocardia humida]